MEKIFIQALCLAIPAVVIFCFFTPYRKKALRARGLYSSLHREIHLLIYVMFIFGIISLKLMPYYYQEHSSGIWGDLILLVERPSYLSSVNLLPLGSIADYREFIQLGTSRLPDVILNRLGNLLVFVPVGFYSNVLFEDKALKRTLFVICSIALLTELGQYFIMRYASIDDIILNVLGGLCGFGVGKLLQRFFPGFMNRFLCNPVRHEA